MPDGVVGMGDHHIAQPLAGRRRQRLELAEVVEPADQAGVDVGPVRAVDGVDQHPVVVAALAHPVQRQRGHAGRPDRRLRRLGRLQGKRRQAAVQRNVLLVLAIVAAGAVYLVGGTVAAATPTPGGVGAVEAALIAGLTATGVPTEQAVPAVLVYRIATFWLPVLPGWLAFTLLTRRDVI
jgi:hypothetical protein